MVGALERAYAMRASLVAKLGAKPLSLTRKTIKNGEWYKYKDLELETRLPSSFRVWLYISKYHRSRASRTRQRRPI